MKTKTPAGNNLISSWGYRSPGKIWHSAKHHSLSASSCIQQCIQSPVREFNSFISFPSSAHTAPHQLIRGSENDRVFTTDSCLACVPVENTAEQHSTLKWKDHWKGHLQVHVSLFFPILHLAQFTSENGANSRVLTGVLAYRKSAGTDMGVWKTAWI